MSKIPGEVYGGSHRRGSPYGLAGTILVSVSPDTRGAFVCDGTADDVEINAALTYASFKTGRVVLLEGTYNITQPLTVSTNNTELCGVGNSTLLYLANDSNCHMINVTANYCHIHHLQLDGNKANNTAVAPGLFGVHVSGNYDTVENCYVHDVADLGIVTWGGDYAVINNNFSSNNGRDGIAFDDNILLPIITNNVSVDNGDYGIGGGATVYGCVVSGNTCLSNDDDGIFLSAVYRFIVSNNNISLNGGNGIFVGFNNNTCYEGVISGNHIDQHTTENEAGIHITGGSYSIAVTGNSIYYNYDGIYLNSALDLTITGNTIKDTDLHRDGIRLNANVDNCVIVGNRIEGKAGVGINVVAATCNDNIIHLNSLAGNSTLFTDAGTDTGLQSVVVPFSDGSDPQDSGYLIDLAGELARAFAFLPKGVQQVIRMKVYARAVAASATTMAAEYVIYGAADNEAYTTHNGSVANHPSTSSNFAADDVIYWTVTTAGVLALVGGDAVEVKVLHEAADGGGVATDAYFRTVEIQYV